MLQRTTQKIAFFLLEIDLIKEEDTEWCIYILKKWILTTSIFVVLFFEGRIWATPVQIIFLFCKFTADKETKWWFACKNPFTLYDIIYDCRNDMFYNHSENQSLFFL